MRKTIKAANGNTVGKENGGLPSSKKVSKRQSSFGLSRNSKDVTDYEQVWSKAEASKVESKENDGVAKSRFGPRINLKSKRKKGVSCDRCDETNGTAAQAKAYEIES